MYGVYNPDRTIHTTTVPGTSWTGLYATDGSINIVLDSAGNGVYHKCGALRVSSSTSTYLIYDPSGAYYSNHILGFSIGGAAPWTPASDPVFIAWWDASDTLRIGQTASQVSSWTDRISGAVAIQPTMASQPIWNATARNGKPGIVNNTGTAGVPLILNGVGSNLPQGSAAVYVGIAGFGLAPGLTQGVNDVFQYGNLGTTNDGREFCAQIGATTNAVSYNSGTGGTTVNTTFDWTNVDKFIEWSVPAGATPTVSMYADGSAAQTGALTGTQVTASQNFSIFGSRRNWNGVIQQIVVANAILTASQQQKVQGWESWYDGKAGANLPGGHPYKSRAPTTSDP